MKPYNYKNCQSLFGYAADVHRRSNGRCQLCGCGGDPIDFNLWRQMTVEHLIGKSQGGYPPQLSQAVSERFPELSANAINELVCRLDAANTVTACSFCNSTTSRDINSKTMPELLKEATGTPEQVLEFIFDELHRVLDRKQTDVRWKLEAVRKAFEIQFSQSIANESPDLIPETHAARRGQHSGGAG